MAVRTYYADAQFTYALQSGAWPDCEADNSQAQADLRAGLDAVCGWDFTYEDPRGYTVVCTLTLVNAPLPCGDMPPAPQVSGLVGWQASIPPTPGQGWDLGAHLAEHLSAVPVVSSGLTFMIALDSLYAWETAYNPPGWLWPQQAAGEVERSAEGGPAV